LKRAADQKVLTSGHAPSTEAIPFALADAGGYDGSVAMLQDGLLNGPQQYGT
jgi:hypothetical protein